jgi:hypothetical protein
MSPQTDLLDILHRHGADALANAVADCEPGSVGLEVHEWRPDLKMSVVSNHNIHADLIEDFEDANIDGLGFVIRA